MRSAVERERRGLVNELERPGCEGRDGELAVPVGHAHDDDAPPLLRLERAQHTQPVEVRHDEVEGDHVGLQLGDLLERVDAVGRFHAKLPVLVKHGHEAADRPVLLRENLEHPVQRRSEVQRAGQRLIDIEQRRQPPGFPGFECSRVDRANLSSCGLYRRQRLPPR